MKVKKWLTSSHPVKLCQIPITLSLSCFWFKYHHYSTDASGAIASEQTVSNSDLMDLKKDLKDAITREGFFSTQTTYSPKENETYIASKLSVTIDDKYTPQLGLLKG